jgi:phage-related minor tail protein
MRALSIETQNLQENIGKALAPALLKLVEAITPIVEKVGEWIDAHPKLAAGIILVAGAAFGLITIVGALGLAIAGLSATAAALGIGLVALLGWMVLIPVAIAAIIAIGALLIAHWTQIKAFFATLWADVKALTEEAWEAIKSYLLGLWDALKDDLEAVYDWFVDKINAIISLYNSVKSKISAVAGAVTSTVKSVVHVNDAIIKPDGSIITTHPDDYLIATKDPNSLGGGVTVNINGGMYLSEDAAERIGDLILSRLKLSNAV